MGGKESGFVRGSQQAWLLERAAGWVESDNASMVGLGLRILGIESEQTFNCPRCQYPKPPPEPPVLDHTSAEVLGIVMALAEGGFWRDVPEFDEWVDGLCKEQIEEGQMDAEVQARSVALFTEAETAGP